MAWTTTYAGVINPYQELQLGTYTETSREVAVVFPDYDWREHKSFGFVIADIRADIFGVGNPLVIYSEAQYFATQRFYLPIVDVEHRIFYRLSKYADKTESIILMQNTP